MPAKIATPTTGDASKGGKHGVAGPNLPKLSPKPTPAHYPG